MAIRTTPIFVQAGSHPAEETRIMLGGMLGMPPTSFAGGVSASNPAHGIVSATDFAVTQNGTPNMTVLVGVGGAFIRGTENLNQGAYHVWNDASVSVSIATAHPTLSRRDLIVVSVTDQAYSGGTSVASISVVTGTAGSGTDPTPPANALVLARVTVAALDTAINTADITNLRPIANLSGKLPSFTTAALAATAIPAPVDGQGYYLNTNTVAEGPYHWNGTEYRRPWNMPWGILGSFERTTNYTLPAIGTDTVISIANVPDVLNRRIRFTLSAEVFNTSAGDNQFTLILERAGTSIRTLPAPRMTTGDTDSFTYSGIYTVPATGTSTYTFSVGYLAVASIQFIGSASPIQFFIEDIGPAGAPA